MCVCVLLSLEFRYYNSKQWQISLSLSYVQAPKTIMMFTFSISDQMFVFYSLK